MYPCSNPTRCGVKEHRDPANCLGNQAAATGKQGDHSLVATPVSASQSAGSHGIPQEELDRRTEMLRDYMDESGYYDDFDGKYTTPHAINPSEMQVALLVTESQSESYIGKLNRGDIVAESLEIDDDDDPQEIENGGESTDVYQLSSITKENGWIILD